MNQTKEGWEEKAIKQMVNRFLGWKLPENFMPDGGISFEAEFNKEYLAKQGKPPMRHEPSGTNLLNAIQAEEMIRYILGDVLASQRVEAEQRVAMKIYDEVNKFRKCDIQFPDYNKALSKIRAHIKHQYNIS